MALAHTFKANGNILTRTSLGGPDGKEIPFKDGKIDGNNISFAVVVDFNGQEMKFNYKGVLSGDEIKLTFEWPELLQGRDAVKESLSSGLGNRRLWCDGSRGRDRCPAAN
jgi:hypothetical protein